MCSVPQIRKQQKEHAELIEEYRLKQQQGAMIPNIMPVQAHPGMMPASPMNQALMGPAVPAQMRPGPGWHPQGPCQMMPAQTQVTGESPHVNFDDTNPFSEGFQERERKERLREQQERQRVQLMKEVERQRLRQRMEIGQQQLLNQEGNSRAPAQMPFFNQNLPQDLIQHSRVQQQGAGFTPQPGIGPAMPNGPFTQDPQGPHGPNQLRPGRFLGHNTMPHNPPFGAESPMPLPPNFPSCPQSLIQLYSNIIPDEKAKKKRNRKKNSDDSPSTPRSDLTAPLTPGLSDTSSTGNPFESSTPGPECQDRILTNIKLERPDLAECHGHRAAEPDVGAVKVEGASPYPAGHSPAGGSRMEGGNELLKHLLWNRKTPPHGLARQMSEDGPRSEEDTPMDSKSLMRQSSVESSGVSGVSTGLPVNTLVLSSAPSGQTNTCRVKQ